MRGDVAKRQEIVLRNSGCTGIHHTLLLICNQQITQHQFAGTDQEMSTILDDNDEGQDSDDGRGESSGTDECKLITRPFVSLGSVYMYMVT